MIPRFDMELRIRGHLPDGEGLVLHELQVTDGRLVSIRKVRSVGDDQELWSPGNAREPILVPGLFDAHVHLRRQEDIDTSRAYGVYGLRDAGSREQAALPLVDRRWISSAGAALVPAAGYGGFLGLRVRDIGECRVALTGLLEKGISFVKVIGSGLVNRRTGGVEPGGFEAEFMQSIVREARALGLSVSAHANGDEAVRAAIRAGVRGVEHGFLMEPETLQRLADHDVYWTPTVYALAGTPSELWSRGGGDSALDAVLLKQLRNLCLAEERGVRLALGTDAGSPGIGFGEAVICEMNWWKRAGLSVPQILKAAVFRARELSGFDKALSVERGESLSLVAVRDTAQGVSVRPLFFEGRREGTGDQDVS